MIGLFVFPSTFLRSSDSPCPALQILRERKEGEEPVPRQTIHSVLAHKGTDGRRDHLRHLPKLPLHEDHRRVRQARHPPARRGQAQLPHQPVQARPLRLRRRQHRRKARGRHRGVLLLPAQPAALPLPASAQVGEQPPAALHPRVAAEAGASRPAAAPPAHASRAPAHIARPGPRRLRHP